MEVRKNREMYIFAPEHTIIAPVPHFPPSLFPFLPVATRNADAVAKEPLTIPSLLSSTYEKTTEEVTILFDW